MNTCEICIEEECNGEMSCDCSTCDKFNICPKKLSPTIRITTKCTQQCSHCCFECSPLKNEFMTIETAKKIKAFIINHDIQFINLMGGEFYCNPDWKEILSILIPGLKKYCRLVTNGDWAGEKNCDEFIEEFKKYDNLKISISQDHWHTNRNVDKAREELDHVDIIWDIPNDSQVEENTIVPIGKSKYEYCMYSSFMSYCGKPERKYSFLITENGDIFKCPFGIWELSNIIDKDFKHQFKQFNQRFYKTFIANCKSCIQMHDRYKLIFLKGE